MARKKKRRGKLTPQQKKFKEIASAANTFCHRETNTKTAYGRCMGEQMKAGLGTKKAKAKAKAKKYKVCQFKSGKKKGKLKPGWRYGSGGKCVRAAG